MLISPLTLSIVIATIVIVAPNNKVVLAADDDTRGSIRGVGHDNDYRRVVEVEEKEEDCSSIADIICGESNGSSSTFCSMIKKNGMFDELSSGNSNWRTVFVPTNDSYEASKDIIDGLDEEQMKDLITFHTVKDSIIMSSDLICSETIMMGNGKDSCTKCSGNDSDGDDDDDHGNIIIYQTGKGNNLAAASSLLSPPQIADDDDIDIVVCNGVIHNIINSWMFPISYEDTGKKNENETEDANEDSIKDKNEDDGNDENSDNTARSLNFFRNEIDTDVFEWVNKSEVNSGDVTCGFLKSNLGFFNQSGNIYPKVRSTSACNMFEFGAEDIYKMYNIITFDQRGVGRSTPSFYNNECAAKMPDPDAGNETSIREYLVGQMDRVESCWTNPEYILESPDGKESYHFLQYSGTQQAVEDIERFRIAIKSKMLSLYGASYGTSVFGLYATVFPENVMALVLDSNMPSLTDLYKLGYDSAQNTHSRMSYLYASCSLNDKFGLTKNKCAFNDVPSCITNAYAHLDGLRDEGKFVPVNIDVTELPGFNDYDTSSGNTPIGKTPEDIMELLIEQIRAYFNSGGTKTKSFVGKICEAAINLDSDEFYTTLVDMYASKSEGTRRKRSASSNTSYTFVVDGTSNGQNQYKLCKSDDTSFCICNFPLIFSKSAPTYIRNIARCYQNFRKSEPGEEAVIISKLDDEGILYMADFLEYFDVSGSDLVKNTPWWLVIAQDYTGDIYDESLFIKQWKIVDDMYNGFGTHIPVNNFLGPNFAGYYWPKAQPIPPLGNPNINGITAGNLQDIGTPFKWTQQMQSHFPSTTLIASQWIKHGMSCAVVEESCQCYRIILDYLYTGKVADDVIDGTTCHTSLANTLKLD